MKDELSFRGILINFAITMIARMAEIRRKFAEFDQDGSGSVSAAEAHQILEKELAFSSAQSAELVARYDQNGDGQLSFEEFVIFYSKVKARRV